MSKTVIEFVDPQDGHAHLARTVRINGADVRVAEGGIQIEVGDKSLTRVTLELLPDEVHFIHAGNTTHLRDWCGNVIKEMR